MEDCELLAQLKSRDASRAEEIIAQVVQGFDKYRKDVGSTGQPGNFSSRRSMVFQTERWERHL